MMGTTRDGPRPFGGAPSGRQRARNDDGTLPGRLPGEVSDVAAGARSMPASSCLPGSPCHVGPTSNFRGSHGGEEAVPDSVFGAVSRVKPAANDQGSKRVRVAPAPARGCARTCSTRACSWEYGRNGRGCRRVRVVSLFW